MELQQLLDIPTGNEPVAELCRKLEAVEMMLKGFHGEIVEGSETLALLSILHGLSSDAFIRNKDPCVQLNTGNCLVQLLKLSSSRLHCFDKVNLQTLLIFLINNISMLQDPNAACFDMCLEHVRSLQTNKTLCMIHFIDDIAFLVSWCRKLFSGSFHLVKKTTEFARRVLQLLLQAVISEIVKVNDVEPILNVLYMEIMDHVEDPTNYEFICKLLRACHRDLEVPTQQLLINHLQSNWFSSEHISKFKLIKTLYCACPQLVALSLGGLQDCLEATTLKESNLDLVLALSQMFAEENLNLGQDCKHLWFCFLHSLRCADKQVQLVGLTEMTTIICNHPELMQSCYKHLMLHCVKEGSSDIVEKVFECIEAFCSSFDVCHIDYLMKVLNDLAAEASGIFRERSLKVVAGILAKILFGPMNFELKIKCNEMMCIINNYYKFGDNRAKSFTQNLYMGYLIPVTLPVEERVLRLLILWLFMSQDMRAVFHDMQRNSFFFQKRVQEVLELCSKCSDEKTKSLLYVHAAWLSEKLDRPNSHQDYLALQELLLNLKRKDSCFDRLKVITDPFGHTIENRISAVNDLLGTLKIKKSNLFPVVEQLCAKLTVNHFDKNCFKVLLQWIYNCIINRQKPLRIFCTPHEMATEGLKLMFEVLFSSPHLAFDVSSVDKITEILEASTLSDATCAAWILKVIAVAAMHKSFKNEYPELFGERVLPLLKKYVVSGTAKESKYAVQALAYHLRAERLEILQQLMNVVFEKARLQENSYLTLLSAVTYLNAFIPWNVIPSFRNILPQFYLLVFSPQLLRNLLFTKEAVARHKESFENRNLPLTMQVCMNRIFLVQELPAGGIYDKDKIPRCTECLMMAIKAASGLMLTMANWAEDQLKSQNMKQRHCELFTLICLNEMYNSLEAPLRDEDKACLRLTAGTAMLKLCQWPEFWNIVPMESFVALSHLMTDGVTHVRQELCKKLTRGLSVESSPLPIDFLAFFVLALLEEDKDKYEEIKGMLKMSLNAKRMVYRHCIYITNECNSFRELVEKKPELLVENSLVVAIFLLAHNPFFSSTTEAPVLYVVENALETLFNALQEGTHKLSIGIHRDFLTQLQSLQSCFMPEIDVVHDKVKVACNMLLNHLDTFRKFHKKHQHGIPILSKYFQVRTNFA